MNKETFKKLEKHLIDKISTLENSEDKKSNDKLIKKLRKELIVLRLSNSHIWQDFNLLY